MAPYFNKTPTFVPTKRGLLELSAHSLQTTLEDIIITGSSCKHMPRCCANNSAEMGQLVPKHFHSDTTVVPVTEREYIYSGRLSVQQIHRNVGSELRLSPTAFMSGASASIGFRSATPPVSLSFLFFSEVKHGHC